MKDDVEYNSSPAKNRAGRVRKSVDPRLVAIVRFLARQAAPRDYQALLDAHEAQCEKDLNKDG